MLAQILVLLVSAVKSQTSSLVSLGLHPHLKIQYDAMIITPSLTPRTYSTNLHSPFPCLISIPFLNPGTYVDSNSSLSYAGLPDALPREPPTGKRKRNHLPQPEFPHFESSRRITEASQCPDEAPSAWGALCSQGYIQWPLQRDRPWAASMLLVWNLPLQVKPYLFQSKGHSFCTSCLPTVSTWSSFEGQEWRRAENNSTS